MGKFLALLRGINVGGNNKVSMAELKKQFEEAGFHDVRTYINSGNIIFTSDNNDEGYLKQKCEELITNKFHLTIPVAIISESDLEDAIDHAPSWWNKDHESKHNAIFVLPPTSVEEVFENVGSIKPEYEQVDHYGQVIFWSAPLSTFSITRWSKIVGTSVYNCITIRNSNTTMKLLQMMKQ